MSLTDGHQTIEEACSCNDGSQGASDDDLRLSARSQKTIVSNMVPMHCRMLEDIRLVTLSCMCFFTSKRPTLATARFS